MNREEHPMNREEECDGENQEVAGYESTITVGKMAHIYTFCSTSRSI